MADIQDAEREELEAIKKWWKENGRVATIGLILGLGGVFGWSWWEAQTIAKEERASELYEQLVNWAAARNASQVNEIAGTLMQEYPKSGYAPLSGLIRASSAFNENQPDEAQAYLQWVVDNTDRADLQAIAKMRIARLVADRGDPDAALAQLDGVDVATLGASLSELRGDLLEAKGDNEGAAAAYNEALADEAVSPTMRRRLELKLDDLGVGGAL